ncbi:MAG: PilZ domain-containing protein [Deltaproteobacteria bacterium]|nr:PilZ domain-containing protein [Deltaproteobacteria bacterium]MBI3295097.1 PilZ domain-containing protein [Deltaproteobacteria bacterium]
MSFLKPSQRRRYERVTVFIPVRVFKNGKEVGKGEVEDLSIGGVYIRTTVPVALGDKIEVEFQFAAMKSILGTVVEINEIDNKAPVRAMQSGRVKWDRNGTGFGIEFSSMSSEMQRVIKKMVKYMAQIQKNFAALG